MYKMMNIGHVFCNPIPKYCFPNKSRKLMVKTCLTLTSLVSPNRIFLVEKNRGLTVHWRNLKSITYLVLHQISNFHHSVSFLNLCFHTGKWNYYKKVRLPFSTVHWSYKFVPVTSSVLWLLFIIIEHKHLYTIMGRHPMCLYISVNIKCICKYGLYLFLVYCTVFKPTSKNYVLV